MLPIDLEVTALIGMMITMTTMIVMTATVMTTTDLQDDGDDDDGASGNNFCVYEGGVAKGECFTMLFILF